MHCVCSHRLLSAPLLVDSPIATGIGMRTSGLHWWVATADGCDAAAAAFSMEGAHSRAHRREQHRALHQHSFARTQPMLQSIGSAAAHTGVAIW